MKSLFSIVVVGGSCRSGDVLAVRFVVERDAPHGRRPLQLFAAR